jgi:hypothetical protein
MAAVNSTYSTWGSLVLPCPSCIIGRLLITLISSQATGDLAKKKTFPALMALDRAGLLPKHASIVGYGRSKWSQEEFQVERNKTSACALAMA